MYNDMLRNVIAILVGNEPASYIVELLQHESLCFRLTELEQPLNDPTTVHVGGKSANLAPEGIDEELYVLVVYAFDDLLDDMVSILILDQIEHILIQL